VARLNGRLVHILIGLVLGARSPACRHLDIAGAPPQTDR
jgi:hypothetical protein